MSTSTKNTSFSLDNSNENNLVSNEQSYIDLIDYCSLRKQFTRIIPSCYLEIRKFKSSKIIPTQNIQEYTKLKEEISLMQEQIDLLKDSKQKKLQEIEELRCLMRKVANKEINAKEKEQIDNFSNTNNKRENKNSTSKPKRKGNNNSDIEGNNLLQLGTTTSSELSEGKDEDDLGPSNIYYRSNRIKSNIISDVSDAIPEKSE